MGNNSSTFANKASKVTGKLYDTAADIGKIRANITVIVGGIIVVIAIGLAISSIATKPTRSQDVTATVKHSQCVMKTIGTGKNQTKHQECELLLSYNINGITYDNTIISNKQYAKNAVVTLKYNPNNHLDVSVSSTGKVLLVIAIIEGISIGPYYYFVTKYKPLSAFEGVRTTSKLVGSLF
jgi:hypothetical protein